MRLVLFGQAAFGQRVLAGLRDAGHEIALVYAPTEADPLGQEATKAGVPLRTPKSYKTPEVAAEVSGAAADLGVLAFVTKIIPQTVIDAPRLGSICFHPSLLPKYRGGNALAWQLIRGETRGGFTVFWTDPGIDTGPILLQREVAIAPEDTAGSLYFDKIFEAGIAGMVDSVNLIAAGKAPREAQDESQASYDPLCTDEHAAIRFGAPARAVYDLIRGCDPQPGAHALWNGEVLRFYGPKRVERGAADAGQLPGTVLSIGAKEIVLAAGTGAEAGAIAVGRVRIGKDKLAAGEAAERAGIAPGSVLGDGAVSPR